MKSSFIKNNLRGIKRSFGRFIAVAAIVALGVGFLTGLLSATPDMKISVDKYYDDTKMYDVQLVGTRPLTDEDVRLAAETDGIEGAVGQYITDEPMRFGNASGAVRIHAFDFNQDINRPELLSGRLPQGADECLAERSGTYFAEIAIGDKIVGESGTYTVTGISGSSRYFGNERVPSAVGAGRLETVIYVNMQPPAYTDIFATVIGARGLNGFSDKYKTLTSDAAKEAAANVAGTVALTREQNASYVSFEQNAEKVDAVVGIFPAFFFLVAALVALTTMTRMVEEERQQIGTLKALGYSKARILSRYLFYCLSAGVLGCVAGALMGFALLPAAIYNAYNFLFHLPPLIIQFNLPYVLISSAAALIAVTAATLWAALTALREKPASLMRPRAPKPGKKVLPERIPFLWKRLSFSRKSTVRNLFRYKRHALMTIVGVGGCTALILTGFGMLDSISRITDIQFGELSAYDLRLGVTDFASDALNEQPILSYAAVRSVSGIVSADGESVTLETIIVDDSETFSQFVTLRTRKKHTPLSIDGDSAVLTEKAAQLIGVKSGDSVKLVMSDGAKMNVTLTGIAETYAGSALYLGDGYSLGANNTALCKTNLSQSEYDDAITALLGAGGIASAEFTAQTAESYDLLIRGVKMIVTLLIVCAGALAVIVLYNLININVQERQRELATLKVLGYYPREVAWYVFRETAILTVVGLLVGFCLGLGLHAFMVNIAESAEMMMTRTIMPLSYLWSTLLTFAFSALVDFVLFFRIRKISMTESLKSNE